MTPTEPRDPYRLGSPAVLSGEPDSTAATGWPSHDIVIANSEWYILQ